MSNILAVKQLYFFQARQQAEMLPDLGHDVSRLLPDDMNLPTYLLISCCTLQKHLHAAMALQYTKQA